MIVDSGDPSEELPWQKRPPNELWLHAPPIYLFHGTTFALESSFQALSGKHWTAHTLENRCEGWWHHIVHLVRHEHILEEGTCLATSSFPHSMYVDQR